MEDGEVGLGVHQLLRSQDVAVLQPQVVLLVEEPLLLDAGHVQDVQLGDDGLQVGGLGVGDAFLFQGLLFDVPGQLQLQGGDKDEVDVSVPAQGVHQGVDSAPEFQVAAEADGEVVQAALFPVDGQKVGKSLSGMIVAAVTGVDDGHLAVLGGGKRRALLGVAHGNDVGVAADGVDGVAHGLALGGGAGVGGGESQHAAAQRQHGGLKTQAGAGGRLKEQSRQLLVGAGVLIFNGVCNNILGGGDQLFDLLHRKIGNVNKISGHDSSSPQPIQLSSEGSARNFFRRSMSSGLIFPSLAATSHTASKLERL